MKKFLLLIALISSSVGAATYPLRVSFGPVRYDTVRVVHYRGDTAAVDSFTITNAYRVDTNYTVTSGLNQFLVKYKNGTNTWSCYREDYYPNLQSAGPVVYHIPVYTRDPIDSVVTVTYENGSLVSSIVSTTPAYNALDYYRLVKRDTIYKIIHYLYLSGRDSALSYVNMFFWDSLGTLTITPPSSHTCIVYGYVGRLRGSKAADVEVTFSLPDKVNDTCTGYMIGQRTSTVYTDAAGYFQDTLIVSSCLGLEGAPRNTKVPYKMTVNYSGAGGTIERNVIVPDSATYRIRW